MKYGMPAVCDDFPSIDFDQIYHSPVHQNMLVAGSTGTNQGINRPLQMPLDEERAQEEHQSNQDGLFPSAQDIHQSMVPRIPNHTRLSS